MALNYPKSAYMSRQKMQKMINFEILSLLLHIKNLLHSYVYQEALYQNSKFISPGVGLLNPGRDQSGHKQLI